MQIRRRMLFGFYWTLGSLWIACHALGLLGSHTDGTFVLLTATTLAATVYGILRHRPTIWWPWALIALSLATFLVGGAMREQLQTTGDLTSSRSLLPDLFTIPGYLVFGYGLVGLMRVRGRGAKSDLDALLDATIGGLAALSFAWLYLVNPALFHADAPLTVRLSLAIYPTISVVFVVVTARLSFSAGRSCIAHRTLLAAMVMMLVGDITYTLVETHLLGIPSTLLDVPYAVAYLFFGFTVIHPAMTELSKRQVGEERPAKGRLGLIGVAMTVPALISLAQRDLTGADRAVLVTVVLGLTLLVIVRVLRAIRSLMDAQAVAAYQAMHDSLTGLQNRRALERDLNAELARDRGRDQIAVLFLDLDRFKIVNDSGGHSVGDELLVAVAIRLRSAVSPDAQVYRLGGDEFVIVLTGYSQPNRPLELAERVRDAFHGAFIAAGELIYSSTSIGIATTPCESAEALLRDADTALYYAKDAGRDTVIQFNVVMRNRAADRLALERDLHAALPGQQLHLHYQPIVDLPSGRVRGFEALLRWNHPTRGNVPPLEFIATAEETGLIRPIGAWVLEQVCLQLSQWRTNSSAPPSLYVSVNVSMRQLRDEGLAEFITELVARHELPVSALRLELTESLVMQDGPDATTALEKLHRAGIPLYIDDFGTGYSSLAYLSQLPVSCVKIDKAFVDPLIRRNIPAESLIAAITAMANALHLSTVAEGVETAEQARRLALLGCTSAQGYLFSRPVPPHEVPSLFDLAHVAGVVTDPGPPAVNSRPAAQEIAYVSG